MTLFAQIDVDMVSDIKMRRATPVGRMLYVQMVLWCRKNEQDGKVEPEFIPDVAADIPNAPKLFKKLHDVGLVEKMGDGWRIPIEVWTKWNPTAQDIAAARRQKADAGHRGRHSRYKHAPDNAHDWCDICHEAGYLVERVDPAGDDPSEALAPRQKPASPEAGDPPGERLAIAQNPITQERKAIPSSIVRDDPTGPVDSPEDEKGEEISRRDRILRVEINRLAKDKGKKIRDRAAWDKKVRENLEKDHGAELDRCLREYPNAPDSAITARAIYGDTSNRLSEYQPTSNETSAA